MRLGIDIGGTKTAALVLDDDGRVVAQRSVPSGRGPRQTMAVAVGVADEVVEAVGGWSAIGNLGACMPGLVDRQSGWARHAVNLDVGALDLAGGIEAATGRRPAVDNDVKAAALGAHHVTDTVTDRTTMAYLNVGTGLAAALVHQGQVVRGAGGAAGEIGHLPVGSGVACSCGQTGCLETVASGVALTRLWPHPPAQLFPAAAAGDPQARGVVAILASGVSSAIQLLVLTGAEVVLIGGGVARNAPALAGAVAADLAERETCSAFLRRLDLSARFQVLDGDLPVAAIGAALLSPP